VHVDFVWKISTSFLYYYFLFKFFSPAVIKILRAENTKLNSIIGEWLEVRFFIGGNKSIVY